MTQLVEPTFEIVYLAVGLFLSTYIFIKAKKKIYYLLLGCVGLTLVICDAMDIIPRMIGGNCFQLQDLYRLMGIGGRAITITMTIFFAAIYFFYRILKKKEVNPLIDWLVAFLVVARITMAVVPLSNFQINESYTAGLYRNIPFICLGFIVVYYSYLWNKADTDYFFEKLEIALVAVSSMFVVAYSILFNHSTLIFALIPIFIGLITISLIKFRYIRKIE